MNGASVVASLPLTSPLITPSTGEAEPRGGSCVLYDTYNTFCTIHIRNIGRYDGNGMVGASRHGYTDKGRVERGSNVSSASPSHHPYICPISSTVASHSGAWWELLAMDIRTREG